MFKLSQEAKIRRDNLKLDFLTHKIKSCSEKIGTLPHHVDHLKTGRKIMMNVAEQHRELGVALKRYVTFDRAVFAERVQNRLDRKHAQLQEKVALLKKEANELVEELAQMNEEIKNAVPEHEPVTDDRFNFFRRSPISYGA
jgi:chromosome segregation ATPase